MYKEMIQAARKAGKANEQTMWKGIDHVSELLDKIKEAHPEEYWCFIRKTHEDMYGPHFNEQFSKYVLENMWYTDEKEMKHEGAHWAKDEVTTAWQGKVFKPDVTACDKWVAANTFYADLNKVLDDDEILDAAYEFWFADEDCESEGKIWEYYNK